jgi:hypothetical protein
VDIHILLLFLRLLFLCLDLRCSRRGHLAVHLHGFCFVLTLDFRSRLLDMTLLFLLLFAPYNVVFRDVRVDNADRGQVSRFVQLGLDQLCYRSCVVCRNTDIVAKRQCKLFRRDKPF